MPRTLFTLYSNRWVKCQGAAAERSRDAGVVLRGRGRIITKDEADEAQLQPQHENPFLPGSSDDVCSSCCRAQVSRTNPISSWF